MGRRQFVGVVGVGEHRCVTTIRMIRRLPFRGTSQNPADSVDRDERGDDEKDRRTPGCPTRATMTTTTTTVSARIRFRSHDVFTREEH